MKLHRSNQSPRAASAASAAPSSCAGALSLQNLLRGAGKIVAIGCLGLGISAPAGEIEAGAPSSMAASGATFPSGPEITKDGTVVLLEEYASAPLSSRSGQINYGEQLGRVNFLRAEPPDAPGSGSRYFVCDLNRSLYLLDKETRAFTTYINFELVFPKFANTPGFAGGLVTFAFDPEYARNGIFYTVHMEDPGRSGPVAPVNTSLPGLNLAGYTTTAAINPPAGSVSRHSVLVEWMESNLSNETFEGTAREILRIGFTTHIHPLGDLIFNPLARPGDSDYRNLYLAVGDGGAGERSGSEHFIPQRLDSLPGKILRITPALGLRPDDELAPNGRYRIPATGPDPNPFIALTLPALKKEIYAYGLRNPHRFGWDLASGALFVNDIGLHSWEEVNIVRKGANYGYAKREGPEELFIGGTHHRLTGSQVRPPVPFPSPDTLIVTGISEPVIPVYPVAAYSHLDGDAISSGFVYRGTLLPQLMGKYLFADITTARLFYCDLEELLAAEDGNRATRAPIHELRIVFQGAERRLFDIIAETFSSKGGSVAGRALPGGATMTDGNDPEGAPYGRGRADIRLALGDDGEIYILSKSDGMIRRLAAVLSPPRIESATVVNGVVTLIWPTLPARNYRVQFKDAFSDAWSDLPGDVFASGAVASKTDSPGRTRFYRVILLP